MNFINNVDSMKGDIIKTTQDIISIRSVEDKADEGAPFGKDMRKCLDKTLDICKSMGFGTKNIDGYAGHAEYGEGDETLGILVHLDVVPEGSGWSVEPYSGIVKDGKLYGRGAIDNKGPAVAAMYALKAVKDSGIKFNKKVRIIFGCDEESGRWECMKHYFKKEKMPDCGFSPDADFPIINSEMGILIFNLTKKFDEQVNRGSSSINLISIKGGNRPNMVPDYCKCVLEMNNNDISIIEEKINQISSEYSVKFDYRLDNDVCTLEAFGVSAHGSTPEKGVNAIAHLVRLLCKLSLSKNQKTEVLNYIDKRIGLETDGHSFGLGMEDEVSGKLVLNFGVLDIDNNNADIGVNIRYPVSNTEEEVYSIIESKIENAGVHLVKGASKGPLHVAADNFLVKKLQKVYKEVTGLEPTLISIGGGTYSRAIKNAVAFGPLFPDQEEVAHQKDEYIAVDDLMKCTNIYAQAIYELVK